MQFFGRQQKGIGCRLAAGDLGAGNDIMEIAGGAGGLQVHLDHIAGAGAGHDAGHAQVFQRRKQLFQAGLAGHALGKALVGQLPDLVQHLLRVAGDILGHVAAQVIAR